MVYEARPRTWWAIHKGETVFSKLKKKRFIRSIYLNRNIADVKENDFMALFFFLEQI